MKQTDMNDNIVTRKWKELYSLLSDEIRAKLDNLDESKPKDYLFKKNKSNKDYPDVGTVFELVTSQNIVVYGIVVNNHIDSALGNDLLTVIILNPDIDLSKKEAEIDCSSNMFIPPLIISTELWKKGFAKNICKTNFSVNDDYSFYDVVFGKFFSDNGENSVEKKVIGIYGISTVFGVSKQVQKELIIQGLV
ncbi:MAG: hypothetical protein VZR24_07500 [Butyrivibrio hungatei]|nr:hypothetical protein [Butyrivibrio hungatei]